MNEVDEKRIRVLLKRQLDTPKWKGLPISDENMELIRDFDNYNAARQVTLSTRHHYVKEVKCAGAMLAKPFKEVTKKDMIAFISRFGEGRKVKTVNNVKIAVKRFYKWLFDMEDVDDYPLCARWMKPMSVKSLIQPEQLITKEEVERLLSECRNQRDRAIIMLIYERGMRPHELLAMKVGDVTPTEYGVSIMVNGKTGPRPLPCIDSGPDLQLWLNMHPLRDDKDAPLWVSVQGKQVRTLAYDGFKSILRRLLKRSGIKRRVWPYLFRHSSLTRLAKRKLPPATLGKVAGWVPGSRMPATYVHLAGADVEDALLREAGIKPEKVEEDQLKAIICPRCKSLNPPGSKFCRNCSLILDVKTALEVQEREDKAGMVLGKLLEDEDFKKLVIEKLKQLGLA